MGEGAHIAGGLALQGAGGGNYLLGSGQPADAPAGHGPALGKAIYREDAVGKIRGHCRKAVVGVAWGQEKFVDLVTHHEHLGMAAQNVGNRFQFGSTQHHARGIARAIEHEQPARWGDSRLQLLRLEPEALVGITGQFLHRGPSHPGNLGVAQPVGGWQQHLIAGAEQHLKEVVEGLLAAIGDQHLGRRGGDVVFLADLGGDRLAQGRFPGGWSVAGLAPI